MSCRLNVSRAWNMERTTQAITKPDVHRSMPTLVNPRTRKKALNPYGKYLSTNSLIPINRPSASDLKHFLACRLVEVSKRILPIFDHLKKLSILHSNKISKVYHARMIAVSITLARFQPSIHPTKLGNHPAQPFSEMLDSNPFYPLPFGDTPTIGRRWTDFQEL